MPHDMTYYLAYYLIGVPVAALIAWPIISWIHKRRTRRMEQQITDAYEAAKAAVIAELGRRRSGEAE